MKMHQKFAIDNKPHKTVVRHEETGHYQQPLQSLTWQASSIQINMEMARISYFNRPVEKHLSDGRGQKKRATAHRIFLSAIELMQVDGYDGVSIEQICARAGVARATFFQHFGNKAAIIGQFSDIVRQRIEAELAVDTIPARDQLRLVADHLQRLSGELGPVVPEMLAAFRREPGVGFRVDDPTTGITKIIVGIVEKGKAEGAFAQHWSAQDIAMALVASWLAVSCHRARNPEALPKNPLHQMLDLYLRGLEPR